MKKNFFILVIVFFMAIGWAKNLSNLIQCDFRAPYKAEFIYGLGIIPGVGMITGWIEIEEG